MNSKSLAYFFDQPWPVDLDLPEVTQTAFNELLSLDNERPLAFHFFTDGSKTTDGTVGSGLVLLIETNLGLHYGGCLHAFVATETTSLYGEHGAMIWALLWAIHVSDTHWAHFGTAEVHFSFNFDATVSGYTAAGYWRTAHAPSWRVILRSLTQILQTRHGQHCLAWNHIKAHTGHPWNEMADALAKFAATSPHLSRSSFFWEQWLSLPDKLCALQWIWYLELMQSHDPRVPQLHQGQMVCFYPHLSGANQVQTRDEIPDTESGTVPQPLTTSTTSINITIATANVMTLKGTSGSTFSRLSLLLEQFHEQGCHIVGVQETRHKHIVGHSNDRYHIVGHASDSRGQDGVQMWISKALPFDEHGTLISKQDIRLVAADPNFLIVKLRVLSWRCLIVTGRAPHSGRPVAETMSFWAKLTQVLQRKAHGLPIFFCGDTNGHLGETSTDAVGDFHAVAENQAGHFFHEWLLQHSLFAPATFAAMHTGEQINTFTSPNGHEVRIDYIAIPHALHYDNIASWVCEDIDLSLHRCDHKAVCCTFAFQQITATRSKFPQQFRPDVQDLAAALGNDSYQHYLNSAFVALPWTLDPHSSASCLAAETQALLPILAKPQKQWKRKTHISEATWELVDHKKLLFKQLRALKKTSRFTTLRACFLCWSSAKRCVPALHLLLRDLPGWFALHDRAFAITQHSLKQAAEKVQQAIRDEDKQLYQKFAEQTETLHTVEGLNGLWKQLRALLPKNRSKSHQTRRDIDAELQQHFEHLEAGTLVPISQLQSQCLQRNLSEVDKLDPTTFLSLQELPTLVEIENLCLRQRPRKAPGPDQVPADLCRFGAAAIAPHVHSVITKAFVYGIEPFAFKGGRLCSIYKGKGNPDDASGYRGILLSNVYGKITHAWARSRLLPTLQKRKTIGQLGGLPSQQTVTGVQVVRLHGQIAHQLHLSSATLFIDLKAAFHHMLRELVFSTSNAMLREVLSVFLDDRDFDIDQIFEKLDTLCKAEVSDIPPGLRRFLHDIHHHTWFELADSFASAPGSARTCTHTRRGTRPGSPLADIGFNLMMTSLLKDIHSALLSFEAYEEGSRAMGTFTPPIAWMDDVAISLATVHASQLTPLIQDTVASVHEVFRQRGLTLNLDKGKTEIIVMFRGPGANPCRTLLFDVESQPSIVVATPTHILSLSVKASYKHLGVRFEMSLDYEKEVKSRIAAARQAFAAMRKQIFLNKAIPVQCRLTLFSSLILSRLFYGCAVWAELSLATVRMIEATLVSFYRRILNDGFWNSSQLTDWEFMKKHSLVPFRIFWARHRLCYLQHVAAHGLTFHKSLLLAEFQTEKGWLHEVVEDLRWFSTFHELPFTLPQTRDDWINAWAELRNCNRWKVWVRRAVLKHTEQEKIAYEVQFYHAQIRCELERAAIEIYADSDIEQTPDKAFRCRACNESFATAQQLAVHSFRIHQERADEAYYVQSEICPGCLKTFHTSYRVLQHLRYRRNLCWDRIHGARQREEPIHVGLPAHLAGVCRLPAIRKHHGPLRPTSFQRATLQVRRELLSLIEEGEADFAWWDPMSLPDLTFALCEQFQRSLAEWIDLEDPQVVDFHNSFFNCICSSGIPEFQAARIFIHWIEHDFSEYVLPDDHLDKADLLERSYMTMLDDIHIWSLRRRRKQLQDHLEWLQQSSSPVPEHQVRPDNRRRARSHCIAAAYAAMGAEELRRRAWRTLSRPTRTPTPEQGPYFIVHLYSGRRRSQDFHEAMQSLVHSTTSAWASSLWVVSIDTAIREDMNVHSETVWSWLLTAARSGRILGLLLGPPCETWSGARFEPRLDAQGQLLRGPRPLRHSDSCWGLERLSLKELRQISVGNCLFLRGLWLCIPIAIGGGAVLLEHPAPPVQMERPSIFRTAMVTFLLRHGWMFRRHTFQQWRHGSPAVKPTSLLYANNPIVAVLDELADPTAVKPAGTLIGVDDAGNFKTAIAKEYPANLCLCFATAIWRRIVELPLRPGEAPDSLAAEFIHASAWVEPGRTMMPDYQPRG